MHNLQGRASQQLGVFGGTITLANAPDLPEGGSPRNQNNDFTVGGVQTRGPFINPFSYANNSSGPNGGGAAVNSSSGVPWSNPGNILLGNQSYATVTLGQTSTTAPPSSATQSGVSFQTTWNSLNNILGNSGYATCALTTIPYQSYQISLSLSGISIPSNAVVTGMSLSIVVGQSGSGAQLVANLATGGISGGLVEQSIPGPPTQISFGGSSYLWGFSTLTPSQINAATFILSANGTSASTISANQVTVTLYYQVASQELQVTQFGFNLHATSGVTGIQVPLKGYSAGDNVTAQLLKAGVPVGTPKTLSLPSSDGTVVFGGPTDSWGTSFAYSDINNLGFGVQFSATVDTTTATVFLDFAQITVFETPTLENFNYVTTYEDSFGNIYTVALDSTGEWWLENVTTNPGVLNPLMSGAPAGSFASSFTGNSRQYIATSDLLQGSYIPQQYQTQWTDRVSQVGPGAAPVFTPIAASGNTFTISTITQPAAHSQGSSYYLQSSGPGSTAPGNVVTVYYLDATVASGPDADLVAAVNSGFPVYVYFSFTGTSETLGPIVVQVTAVGEGQPPGQPRQFYYFTYNLASVAFDYHQGSGNPGFTANYQRSLATMTMTAPVPGLVIGNKVTVTGSSVSGYNSTWAISQTPTSGSFTITQTQVTSGVATFSYSLINGVAPIVGELITITGTTNANGQLNLINATIVTASGGSTGTFTINVSLPTFAAVAEQGQAVTAGRVFDFDPGAALVGSGTNPIFGNATGGSFTFQGSGQFVTPGTRKGTVFFITRNGFWTKPAPPVIFTTPNNTTGIKAANIPIGPPDVIARAIAFTEAGANGVPGANFYTIPQPVQYTVQNVNYTANSLFINDNVTTTATFFFNDAVLLDAEEIDIQGNNLFNLGELGEAGWCVQYAGRSVWGRVRNKIQNLLNLSFDGGYLSNPGANLLPLGWNVYGASIPAGSSPTLLNSPIFGNSLYVKNASASTQTQFCLLYQSAFQDWNNVAILQNQTPYSVRVTCRTPSGATSGSLVIDLTSYDTNSGFGTTYGTFTLPLSSMTTAMSTFQGTLLTRSTLNIPANLQLRLWFQNLPNGADCEIDSMSIFPTLAPTNLTGLVFSYGDGDYESFDLVTGGQDTTTVNSQPANGAFEMHGTLYVVKESSLGFLKDSPNQEPANWNQYEEVSNVAGAAGINAFDVGEEWAVMGCQNGLFLFNGGQPMPIQLENPEIWQAINWQYGYTLCVRNDVANRKIYCAIPLATPNPWMVTTVVNSNPTTPNVLMTIDYQGIGSVEQLMDADPMHMTMTGKLAIHDFRRKWSLWDVPTPYLGMVKRNELQSTMLFCNGIASSKIYELGTAPTGQDDWGPTTSDYCTYGFVDQEQAQTNPMFGLYNKRYALWDILCEGSGNASLTFYQNSLRAPYPFVVPGGVTLTSPQTNDLQGPLNEYAQRLFVEIQTTGGWYNLSRVTLAGAADKWAPVRGF